MTKYLPYKKLLKAYVTYRDDCYEKELHQRLFLYDKIMKILKEDLCEYLQHDSWRCGYHQECHCGLNDLTDKLGLERIELPQKGA
jgi:hypothetical protein